jgi:tRNA-specific 2-thiouridylase
MAERVVLAMSGGVDSSVAAYLLKDRGYDVVGVFMRTGAYQEDAERRAKTCCSVADALDARRVADRLDLPFFAIDFEQDFGKIQDYFVDEYLAGRTPNPCVMCNLWLKFGKLWAYGQQVGADFVATGHYARIVTAADGSPRVARGRDRAKDQSYVLSGLRSEMLPRILFPVGELPKSEVREIARTQRLPVHDKPESQDICFVPDGNYLEMVHRLRPGRATHGPIVDQEGRHLGTHPGIEGFTIGQRRGLGVALGTPHYVVQIEPATRTVTVGPRQALDRSGLVATRFNWQGPIPDRPLPCLAQIRAQHQAVEATVEPLGPEEARVIFQRPQPAVAPGQIVTVYQEDLVLGGGWIEQAI